MNPRSSLEGFFFTPGLFWTGIDLFRARPPVLYVYKRIAVCSEVRLSSLNIVTSWLMRSPKSTPKGVHCLKKVNPHVRDYDR